MVGKLLIELPKMTGRDDLVAENDRLKKEVDRLASRIMELEKKFEFLETHTLLARGIRGESLISTIVSGTLTSYAASHDVETAGGCRLEVKYSALHTHIKKYPDGASKWQWAKLLGEAGQKVFDYLLLVGEADRRFQRLYKDASSPYVIFCLPFSEIERLTTPGQKPGYRNLRLLTRPSDRHRAAGRELFERYQITVSELAERFGL